MRELAEEQGEVFLEKLVEHDKRLAVMVAEAVMCAVDGGKVSDVGTSERQDIGTFGKLSEINLPEDMADGVTEQSESMRESKAEEGLPDEALFYLSNL